MWCLLEESAFRRGPERLCSSVHAWGCSVWAELLGQTKRIPPLTVPKSEFVTKSWADFSVLTWARLPHWGSEFLKSFPVAGKVLTTQWWLHTTPQCSIACSISCLLVQFLLHRQERTPWHPYFHSPLSADKVVTLCFHFLTCHSLFNTLQPVCAPSGHRNFSHRLSSLPQSFLLRLLDCLHYMMLTWLFFNRTAVLVFITCFLKVLRYV